MSANKEGPALLKGEGRPQDTDGEDGDMYVDARKGFGDLYGPKQNGHWPAPMLTLFGPDRTDDRIIEGK